eukprot:CAMPEP_0170640636 /NCGR_PEP_ID=MMETSP0224-20130122/40335_1 /TAXON_ID=285029 /ORGANISM="Togula jolla, Strain CCCM 725" /LENGTH=66 /DNA_ID=CAMNT_0010971165 /DNA_START=194 /DNA_END=394 /DNA_ORIENTATION=-
MARVALRPTSPSREMSTLLQVSSSTRRTNSPARPTSAPTNGAGTEHVTEYGTELVPGTMAWTTSRR